MRRIAAVLLILFPLGLISCSTGTPPATPEVVSVYSTSAAEPWLPALYECAGISSILNRVDESSMADIVLQVGEPKALSSFVYQIDTEDVLIVTHRQSPIQNLTLDDARALFSGVDDSSVQAWVYASGTDVQEVFDQFVMEGRSVSSTTMIAPTLQQMSNTLVNQPNAVGILTRHWLAGDPRVVYSLPNIPVLVMTRNEPQGAIQNLIACMQR